jgi:hypothetical protein
MRSETNRKDTLFVLALTATLTFGCGASDDGTNLADSATDSGGELLDLTEPPEAVTPPDNGPIDTTEPDTASCDSEKACVGDLCSGNDDCDSGYCVPHMGDMVCTETCILDCRVGFACQLVDLFGSDDLFLCVSKHPQLCRPCLSSEQCAGTIGDSAPCVDLGAEVGRFCGAACSDTKPCPDEYVCTTVTTTEGNETQQCTPVSGECSCSALSTELGLYTKCTIETAEGTCEALRVCTDQGLTACEASTATLEVCDGVDNNCDGLIDEGTCNDDNPCTADQCQPSGVCANTPDDSFICDDGSGCTLNDQCEDGTCVGDSQLQCDDGNPCTIDQCDPESGCSYENAVAECDDGNECTTVDQCIAGICSGAGQMACDDNNPCTADTCDKTLGCVSIPKEGSCTDGNVCTPTDTCVNGDCVGSGALACNDNSDCTIDFCNPVTGCDFQEANLPCDDGNQCTPIDLCSGGMCVGTGEINCDDGNPCTADACNAQQGCTNSATSGNCTDGNVCTLTDTCANKQCVGSGEMQCNDNNPCTVDYCNPTSGCVNDEVNMPCNDGNACTPNDQCMAGFCSGFGTTTCPIGQVCESASGCVLRQWVYAETWNKKLYRVNVVTLEKELIGTLGVSITDIAEAQDGTLYGVSFTALYGIDTETAATIKIGDFSLSQYNDSGMNGLTVAPDGTLYGGTGTKGNLYRIDPDDASIVLVGPYGTGFSSSGDIVWGPWSAIYVADPDGTSDQLLSVNPATGVASVIGSIGFPNVYGLSFANGGLYGFDDYGNILQINFTTGQGTKVGKIGSGWYGSS